MTVTPLRPCNRTGCPAAATVAFKMHAPANGFAQDHEPLTAILGIQVCQAHFDEDAEGFFERNPNMLEAIAAGCRMVGKAPPDPARAWVTAVPLTSPEYLHFEKMAKGR